MVYGVIRVCGKDALDWRIIERSMRIACRNDYIAADGKRTERHMFMT